MPVVEGLSSVGLLAADTVALEPPPVENFRQSAYDSLLGWIGLPNLAHRDNFGPGLTLTTDAAGLRIHRPRGATVAPDERAVICSGASFTFGSGVGDTDTFCARLEQELPGVRTINAAQRGYGIDQSYLWYVRDGGRHAHEVQLFALNATDFERTASRNMTGYPKPVLALRDGKLVPENVPVPQWTGWSRWQAAKPLLADLRTLQLLTGFVDAGEAAQLKRIDDAIWPVVEAAFTELNRLNAERGSTLAVVYLPGETENEPNVRDARRERLTQFFQRAGITFIDLTPDLRRVPADSLPWMFITPNALEVNGASGHYTAQGHAWVARRLAEHLRAAPVVSAVLPARARATAAAGG